MKTIMFLALVIFSGSVLAQDLAIGQVRTDTSVASHCDQDRSVSSVQGNAGQDGQGSVRQ